MSNAAKLSFLPGELGRGAIACELMLTSKRPVLPGEPARGRGVQKAAMEMSKGTCTDLLKQNVSILFGTGFARRKLPGLSKFVAFTGNHRNAWRLPLQSDYHWAHAQPLAGNFGWANSCSKTLLRSTVNVLDDAEIRQTAT